MLEHTIAGIENKPCDLTDIEIARVLLRHIGRERLIAILTDLVGETPPYPSHSQALRRRRAEVSSEKLLRTQEWCARAFQNVIRSNDTGTVIVIPISDSQRSEIDLGAFALTFFDAITPDAPDQMNLEQMIDFDEAHNLGYADWLKNRNLEPPMNANER